ncbi:MAG: HPr family phosphocarrier protein, partial [Acidimicrobiia bacterium]|nr:HPr family phosphocarrier protein [Acidimicrobiia bacterium]
PGAADVMVETGFEFVIDRTDWQGAEPDPTPIIFTSNLAAYKLRKLWLVNGLHVLTAWLGLQRGHEYIHEAIADEDVAAAVSSAGSAAARALASKTDEFDVASLEEYCASSLQRFTNSELPDVAVRVARNPLAKLAAGERVMGPATAADENGLPIDGFAQGIAAALVMDDPSVAGSSDLRDAVDRMGWDGVVVDHCGAARGGPLFTKIETEMQKIENERSGELITEELVITNPSGLHARPAAEIVEFAKKSEADIQIHKGDKAANAKSIMSVLALGANTGDTVTIVAEGDGAADVVEELRNIMLAQEH